MMKKITSIVVLCMGGFLYASVADFDEKGRQALKRWELDDAQSARLLHLLQGDGFNALLLDSGATTPETKTNSSSTNLSPVPFSSITLNKRSDDHKKLDKSKEQAKLEAAKEQAEQEAELRAKLQEVVAEAKRQEKLAKVEKLRKQSESDKLRSDRLKAEEQRRAEQSRADRARVAAGKELEAKRLQEEQQKKDAQRAVSRQKEQEENKQVLLRAKQEKAHAEALEKQEALAISEAQKKVKIEVFLKNQQDVAARAQSQQVAGNLGSSHAARIKDSQLILKQEAELLLQESLKKAKADRAVAFHEKKQELRAQHQPQYEAALEKELVPDFHKYNISTVNLTEILDGYRAYHDIDLELAARQAIEKVDKVYIDELCARRLFLDFAQMIHSNRIEIENKVPNVNLQNYLAEVFQHESWDLGQQIKTIIGTYSPKLISFLEDRCTTMVREQGKIIQLAEKMMHEGPEKEAAKILHSTAVDNLDIITSMQQIIGEHLS